MTTTRGTMAKPKTKLLDDALALPDAPRSSLEHRLKMTGRKEEVDDLLDRFVRGELAAKFPSHKPMRLFLQKQLGFPIGTDALSKYMARRNEKKKPS